MAPHDFGRNRLSFALPKMTPPRSRTLWRVVDILLDLALIPACSEADAWMARVQLLTPVDPAFESAQPPPWG